MSTIPPQHDPTQPGFQPGHPSTAQQPERRSFFRRHKILTGLGALVALVVVVSAANGMSSDDEAVADTPVHSAPQASDDVRDHADDVDVSDDADDDVDDAAEDAQDAAEAHDDWYESQWGSFDSIRESGTGKSVVRLPDGVTAGMVTATHKGSSNFAITALDEHNESTGDLLVNTIGRYSGTTAFGISAFGDARSLQITADGAWTLTIEELSDAPALPTSGTGDGVFRFDAGATVWDVTNKGDSNFVVMQVSDSFMPNLAVNEIGAFRGQVPAQSGPSIVMVTSDGAWTIRS